MCQTVARKRSDIDFCLNLTFRGEKTAFVFLLLIDFLLYILMNKKRKEKISFGTVNQFSSTFNVAIFKMYLLSHDSEIECVLQKLKIWNFNRYYF